MIDDFLDEPSGVTYDEARELIDSAIRRGVLPKLTEEQVARLSFAWRCRRATRAWHKAAEAAKEPNAQ